jgi:glycosyltransferase involved in cell wall biosynthesis
MKFTLIHPSRGRAHLAHKTYQKWMSSHSSQHTYEYILSIDSDDPQFDSYSRLFAQQQIIINIAPSSTVIAINSAAKTSTGKVIIVISDDFEALPDWDLKIAEATAGKTDWILKTQDGTQGWMITLPIMDRAYYNRFGYVYNPIYRHMFADTEMTCVADLTGKKIVSDLQFKHNHYSVGGIQKDETSVRADNTWGEGERSFMDRWQAGFGVDKPEGKVKDESTIKWVQRRLNSYGK